MFKKSERLSRVEFTHFFGVGTKKHSKHLTFICSPTSHLKVAVVVGKKVAKSAVKRNTLKRRVYATLRRGLGEYQGALIVIVKPTFASLPRKDAEIEVKTMIAQVAKCA
jgi:ribonuclease P protein component